LQQQLGDGALKVNGQFIKVGGAEVKTFKDLAQLLPENKGGNMESPSQHLPAAELEAVKNAWARMKAQADKLEGDLNLVQQTAVQIITRNWRLATMMF